MAISTQIQNLNLIPGKSAPVVVHLSQGNIGNTVQFYLYDGDNPYYPTNVSIAVHGVRADNTVFGPYTVSFTSGSNLVSFNIVSAMTSVTGAAIGELVISDSNQNQIGSANFGMLIEEAPYSSSVTYEDDLSIYQRILAYVQSVPATLEGKISNLNSSLASEISNRASADATLSSRIDQIVAPSGEAPSQSEVLDARTGFNGAAYNSLGNAIRSQVSDLRSDYTDLAGTEQLITNISADWNTQSFANGVWTTKSLSGTNANAQISFTEIYPATNKKYYLKMSVKLVSGTITTMRGFAFFNSTDTVTSYFNPGTLSSEYTDVFTPIEFTGTLAKKLVVMLTSASNAVLAIKNIKLYADPLDTNLFGLSNDFDEMRGTLESSVGIINENMIHNVTTGWNTASYLKNIWITNPLGNNANAQIQFDDLYPEIGKDYYVRFAVKLVSGTLTAIRGFAFYNADNVTEWFKPASITSEYTEVAARVTFTGTPVNKLVVIVTTASNAVLAIKGISLVSDPPLYNKLMENSYASIGCYETFGVIGDSFASGVIYDSNGTSHTVPYLSWGKNLARRLGNTCELYSKGGATTETWLASDTWGLGKMNSDPALKLYILNMGINEQDGTLGTIDDIHDGNPSLNPNTFYGNYGKIIEAIKAHAPKALIVMATIKVENESWYTRRNAIIKNIAGHYGLPVLDFLEDPFFQSEVFMSFVGGHPTANAYSGMALAIDRLYSRAARNYKSYFENYIG